LSLRLHGDEWLSFNTTADGYSVVKDSKGYYVYAQLNEGRLLPTEHVAHDATERSDAENQWLTGVRKFQAPAMSERNIELKAAEVTRRSATLEKRRAAQYDYTKFRGLVILVEFNDCSFSRDDYQQVMDDMLNCGDILFLRFSISLLQINGEILDERLHLVRYAVNT
jgi:hypothetical protein